MEKKKILNKKEILKLFSEGHLLRYDTIWSTCEMVDKEKNYISLGVVRFDTYLKMKLKKVKSDYSSTYYTL